MKFDKKVMESGIVAAFTLVMTVSSVCGNPAATQAPDSQEVELSAEPAGVGEEFAAATKERIVKNVVTAAITENEPEQKAEEIQEVSNQEKVAAAEGAKEAEAENSKTTDKPQEAETEEPKATDKPQEAETEEPKAAEEPKETEAEKPQEAETEESKETEDKEPKAEAETAEPEEAAKAGALETEAKAEEPETAEEAAVLENTEDKEEPEEPKTEVTNTLVAVGNEEVSPWASKLLPNVEDYLNIRTEPSDEAELAGKLHKGASADILEKGEEWTKISSGSVEGYVKNEFCVTGLEAESLANQVGTTYATAVTGGVRVRETTSASEDTEILDVLEEGGKIKVDTEAEAAEGWVPVKLEEGTGYVSEEFVEVELKLGKAISIEEERAAIAAAEAEKARKAQQSSGGTSQRGAVSASYDDVTLLGALIQCEAGSEPYEGKLAVGAVVMNRLRAGYAGSISGVIYQGGQFTPASSGALASALANGVSGSCIQAAQEAIAGASNVGGATSFRNAASGASGIVIGNHVFF